MTIHPKDMRPSRGPMVIAALVFAGIPLFYFLAMAAVLVARLW